MSRSARIHEFGDATVLRIENVEVGEPALGEVRLRIHAIGVNRTEITLRSGRSPVKPALPHIVVFPLLWPVGTPTGNNGTPTSAKTFLYDKHRSVVIFKAGHS
jgi:hypothetical protein